MITGAAGSSNTYDFNALGIKFTVASSGATADTAVATGIALLGGTVSATGTPTLAFQTGAASADSYSFSALNVLTTGGNNSSTDFTDIETSLTAITTAVGAANNTNVNNEFTTLSGRIDSAINKINTQRATLGSQMNRLSYTNTNLLAQSTNMQNSRSAVIDTDFAKETASLTKGQIMQQAATAMLAQANQMPNVILSLLK
jgi:flagellin